MIENKRRYFIIYKPYNMVSQFVSPDAVRLLGDLDFDFPEGTHAIGRLDINSEGLLILTTDKRVTKLLFEGSQAHERTYLVQVKNIMEEATLAKLRAGVDIEVALNNMYHAKPKAVVFAEQPENFVELFENYRYVPHTWISMTLTEGKFHQVRKMVKAVKHPCKRLVRVSIENIKLGNMKPGEVRELTEIDFFNKLGIKF